ncbi:hypothetical protein B0H16DRAFT_1448407 [Mycena metata]|uniref:Uncharacterized protein n=1 Tax=Mycena metata TaxID=1033252 RepID=A0AAD7K7J0_9AGAR|nr:hypothetical protein B0H16DRAFT_1448407 [Mycena metata]
MHRALSDPPSARPLPAQHPLRACPSASGCRGIHGMDDLRRRRPNKKIGRRRVRARRNLEAKDYWEDEDTGGSVVGYEAEHSHPGNGRELKSVEGNTLHCILTMEGRRVCVKPETVNYEEEGRELQILTLRGSQRRSNDGVG